LQNLPLIPWGKPHFFKQKFYSFVSNSCIVSYFLVAIFTEFILFVSFPLSFDQDYFTIEAMKASELRQKYLAFFKNKGHAIMPSASLVPENDPTTLFTGSGMQPMLPYLLGQKHPLGTRIADSQKCFRSQDIEEVGDNRHTTYFEMLGNWSLGDYYKEEQLAWFFEFLTRELGLDPQRLYVSVFAGNQKLSIPRDDESVGIWQKLFGEKGIEAKAVDKADINGMQGGRIFYYDESKNWWSRAATPRAMPVGEPGGPDSEVFYDFGAELKIHEHSSYQNQPCHPNCNCGRFLEIGNSVFMAYQKTPSGFAPLPKKNVDFGGGLERILASVNGNPDIFTIDLFRPLICHLEEISGKKYQGNEEDKKPFRVIADHVRAAVMLAADGVFPSNKDQGYFSRRLLRRSIRYAKTLGIEKNFLSDLVPVVADMYQNDYANVKQNEKNIVQAFHDEEEKFRKTLGRGLKIALAEQVKIDVQVKVKVAQANEDLRKKFSGKVAFDLYQTYGFPIEMTIEIAKEKGMEVDLAGFEKAKREHQELSRRGAQQKFAGGLLDHSEKTTRLHTATHLLHEALRRVLGPQVKQAGSNITPERLRFDFTHQDKLSEEELQKIAKLVNEIVQKNLLVVQETMSLDKAKKQGALALFGQKYGEKVKVYKIVDPSLPAGGSGQAYSIEVCGGPHVVKTGELGKFRILKQENIGKGIRRIRAVLE